MIAAVSIVGGESMDRELMDPSFDTKTENITAIAGETAELRCIAENKRGYGLIWLNPRKTLISKDESRYIDDSRISVERPNIRYWNIIIREVRFNDSGEYMCQINTKPVLIKRINLFVREPKVPARKVSMKSQGHEDGPALFYWFACCFDAGFRSLPANWKRILEATRQLNNPKRYLADVVEHRIVNIVESLGTLIDTPV
ncbi:hypothetical protein DPMN_056010 [Dreissena polymorpha]|uniref:Ig-like domain-containing protein n=1 Tax=Dreissena polymorpha TaxID=45954 RepID=A0A9D4HR45_DREPO|nr:hypothetical protein DPMN_056010 [Dreissena polymorpha]